MRCYQKRSASKAGVLALYMLAVALFSVSMFATNDAKNYPETGKIVGKGINRRNKAWSGAASGRTFSKDWRTHTYRIETDTQVLEVDCEKEPLWGGTAKECGGEGGLKIGDVIKFRIGDEFIYISVPSASEKPGAGGPPKEEKLRIVGQEAKPEPKSSDPKPADARPAADPKAAETNAAESK